MVIPSAPVCPLRAMTVKLLVTPTQGGNTKRESRLFAAPAPKLWNRLPTDISTAEAVSIYCRRRKSHLFSVNITQIVKITSYISFFCVAIEAACVSVKPCVLAWFLFFLVLYLHGWMHFLWDALELCQLNNVISCTNRIHPPSHPRLLAFSLWANCVIMGNMIKLINERHVCVITWIGKCMSGRKQGVISQSYSY